MLISALCDYYDILAKADKVLPDGFSNVGVHYLVCLNEMGEIDEIIDWRRKEEREVKGKIKENRIPRDIRMPKRTEKTAIDANVIEHRPLYLFGLNLVGEELVPQDEKNRARKSHEAFVSTNLAFLQGLDSPVINAYRKFIENWTPEKETENTYLLGLGKDYAKSGYAFCLTGRPDQPLHEQQQIKEKWLREKEKLAGSEKGLVAQCAVTGENSSIARVHSKIKGVAGGLPTGTVLIGFKNDSGKSYGNEQSYNSNISEEAMKKYTEALNYLLSHKKHKMQLDDLTIVSWAMDQQEACEDLVRAMLFGQSDTMNAEQTEAMLHELLQDARQGQVLRDRLSSMQAINPDVDFYMLGLKPNSSRLAVKFIYRRQFADVLWNIAKHQEDMCVSKEMKPVALWQIQRELIPPKSNDKTTNPALIAKLFEAIINGTEYPISLLEMVVRRVKTDAKYKINVVRAGIIKACINRISRKKSHEKEELKVALDKENRNQAYLCGRLFAVLEKLQQEASNNSLNRTIRDSFFSSAASTPALVFPKLLKLAQNHMNKVKAQNQKSQIYYNKLIQEIFGKIQGEFLHTLPLIEQGKFMVGYYQQYGSFFQGKEGEQLKENEMEVK